LRFHKGEQGERRTAIQEQKRSDPLDDFRMDAWGDCN
jgi:hypothetical protein